MFQLPTAARLYWLDILGDTYDAWEAPSTSTDSKASLGLVIPFPSMRRKEIAIVGAFQVRHILDIVLELADAAWSGWLAKAWSNETNPVEMASNVATNLRPMASTSIAMASNLRAMASNLIFSDGLQPHCIRNICIRFGKFEVPNGLWCFNGFCNMNRDWQLRLTWSSLQLCGTSWHTCWMIHVSSQQVISPVRDRWMSKREKDMSNQSRKRAPKEVWGELELRVANKSSNWLITTKGATLRTHASQASFECEPA